MHTVIRDSMIIIHPATIESIAPSQFAEIHRPPGLPSFSSLLRNVSPRGEVNVCLPFGHSTPFHLHVNLYTYCRGRAKFNRTGCPAVVDHWDIILKWKKKSILHFSYFFVVCKVSDTDIWSGSNAKHAVQWGDVVFVIIHRNILHSPDGPFIFMFYVIAPESLKQLNIPSKETEYKKKTNTQKICENLCIYITRKKEREKSVLCRVPSEYSSKRNGPGTAIVSSLISTRIHFKGQYVLQFLCATSSTMDRLRRRKTMEKGLEDCRWLLARSTGSFVLVQTLNENVREGMCEMRSCCLPQSSKTWNEQKQPRENNGKGCHQSRHDESSLLDSRVTSLKPTKCHPKYRVTYRQTFGLLECVIDRYSKWSAWKKLLKFCPLLMIDDEPGCAFSPCTWLVSSNTQKASISQR